jgi:hypothetical protein
MRVEKVGMVSNIKKHYDILREIHEGKGEGVRNGCDTNVSH